MNIYDIARLTGVSTATVSRVLNNSGNVSKETREKITKVISENSFTPNVYARGLNTNSMNTIGVIVSNIADLYFSKAVSIIERELKKNGFDIILYCTGEDLDSTSKYISNLVSKKVDGIIFVGSKFKLIEKKTGLENISKEIPIAMINAEASSKKIISVLTDDKGAVCDTVKYLRSKGHKKFLYLYDTESPSGINKLEGFEAGISECNIAHDDKMIIKCPRDIAEAKKVVINEFTTNKDITAIVTSEDELAVGAVKACNKMKLRVGKDVAVTGYNNSILSLSTNPELTSIDNKLTTLCELAVKMILDCLDKQTITNKIKIDCELIIRQTT